MPARSGTTIAHCRSRRRSGTTWMRSPRQLWKSSAAALSPRARGAVEILAERRPTVGPAQGPECGLGTFQGPGVERDAVDCEPQREHLVRLAAGARPASSTSLLMACCGTGRASRAGSCVRVGAVIPHIACMPCSLALERRSFDAFHARVSDRTRAADVRRVEDQQRWRLTRIFIAEAGRASVTFASKTGVRVNTYWVACDSPFHGVQETPEDMRLRVLEADPPDSRSSPSYGDTQGLGAMKRS